MAFMVANTGRAASRAFYLNLARQPGVFCVPRRYFDSCVSMFIRQGNRSGLDQLIQLARMSRDTMERGVVFGIVFHAVRPNLFPFGSSRNRELLEILRDELEVEQVFFPVRDMKSVFLSELNRQMAYRANNWSFPQGSYGWKRDFSLAELISQPSGSNEEQNGFYDRNPKKEFDVSKLDMVTMERTGQINTMYDMFSSVFPRTFVFDYQRLIDKPLALFRTMADLSGFTFDHTELLETKLNSLANRLLIWNPITLSLGKKPGRRRVWKRKSKKVTVRYRIELRDALPVCRDWGEHHVLEADYGDVLAPIERDLKGHFAFGVCGDDLAKLPPNERMLCTHNGFASKIASAIGPGFVRNFETMKEFYRNNVYFSEFPGELEEIVSNYGKKEYEKLFDRLEKRKLLLLDL